jgi:hypothetical protein
MPHEGSRAHSLTAMAVMADPASRSVVTYGRYDSSEDGSMLSQVFVDQLNRNGALADR